MNLGSGQHLFDHGVPEADTCDGERGQDTHTHTHTQGQLVTHTR